MFIYNLQYLLINMYSKCLTLYIQRYIMMMKGVLFMTQINFRIEEDIKENAEKALKDMGLTMSSAITMFLVKVGREKRIPFEITADPFYSESNIRYLEKIASDIKNGKATFSEHALIDGED